MQEPILLVEDDQILQLSLTMMLQRDGYTVDTARSIAEARLAILSRHPRIILLDLGLPDGSGFDILNWLSLEPDSPLIIVTTANDTPKAAIDALGLGAFDYLIKPINREILRYTLRRAVRYDQLRQHVRDYERLRDEVEEARSTVRSVTHHISQMLTVMMGEAQLAREEVSNLNLRANLDQIVRMADEAAQRVATLRGLRLFATRDPALEPPAD